MRGAFSENGRVVRNPRGTIAVSRYSEPMLLGADVVNSIRIQHIRQRHDAFEFVNIRSVNDRQEIEMVLAHAFQSQMQRMIRVEVRKIEGFHKVFQRLFLSAIDKGAFKSLSGQHSQKVTL